MPIEAKSPTRKRNRPAVLSAAAVLIAVAFLAVWLAVNHAKARKLDAPSPMSTMSGMSGMASPASASTPPAPAPSTEPQVDLAPDDLKKAQLRTAHATTGSIEASLRTPGVVKADEYTEVHVTPLVGGLVKQVPVVLGQHVYRGQPLAVLFSVDLADAETTYISDLAEFEADHKKLERTQTLLNLGAASQQEEEEVAAAHAAHQAHVQASRKKLELLGASSHQIAALEQTRTITANLVVPAPINGVVLTRSANLGLVASPAQEMFTVADLSKVWVLASVNEKDFATVRVGSPASISAPAYPGRTWKGRVEYIQPQVDPSTRTAQARIAVANLDENLRLDMYVDVDLSVGPDTSAEVDSSTDRLQSIVIPQSAIQAIGDKEFVFVPLKNIEGSFALRQVEVGPATHGNSSILNGLKAGEEVVTDGSFILKAEAVRQHPELQ